MLKYPLMAAAQAKAGGGGGQPSIQQLNAMARSQILSQSVEMIQNIYSATVTPANSPVLQISPRNVGLIKGFYVDVTATVTNPAGSAITPGKFGAANLLSNITFNDLNNNVRINTSGWHLHFVDTARNGRAFVDAYNTNLPVPYGNNYTGMFSQTASINASSTGTIVMRYYIPLAYSDDDLRGSIYANVVNATMNLQLTFSTGAGVSVAAGDAPLALYTGNAGATLSAATVNVYQVFLDQLPIGQNGPVLPLLDLSTIYELKNTQLVGMSANTDFPIPYSNFRDFLSTICVYDNGSALTAGTDIAYWALQSANFTNIWKVSPNLAALFARRKIMTDYPAGVYYFESRRRPLNTIQYGNLELILNASTVNAGAQLLIGYEDMALINNVTGAGSLPGG